MKVLAYHEINQPHLFKKQLKLLKNTYKIIGLKELEDVIKEDVNFQNHLLLTFDDGDKSFYENAFPVLKELKISAIIFVITDLINSHKPFWWDEIEYYLGSVEGNAKVWEVKTWSNKKREAFLKELRKSSQKPLFQQKQLTTNQLREMQTSGITIANHSHTHPMFNQCTVEELDFELNQSTQILEKLGLTPNIFAYPNGNYSELAEEKLKDYNTKIAFLFDHKINRGKINPLRISRLAVNDYTPLWKLKLILSGWHTKILPITRTLSKLRKK